MNATAMRTAMMTLGNGVLAQDKVDDKSGESFWDCLSCFCSCGEEEKVTSVQPGQVQDIQDNMNQSIEQHWGKIFSDNQKGRVFLLFDPSGSGQVFVEKGILYFEEPDFDAKICMDQHDFARYALMVLRNKYGSDPQVILPVSNFSGLNLQGADFSGWELQHPNFQGTILTGTQFVDSRLIEPKFNIASADRDKQDSKPANVSGANFTRTIMPKACMYDVDASAAFFTDADLSQGDLVDVNFEGSEMTGVTIQGADVDGANFAHVAGDIATIQASVKNSDKAIWGSHEGRTRTKSDSFVDSFYMLFERTPASIPTSNEGTTLIRRTRPITHYASAPASVPQNNGDTTTTTTTTTTTITPVPATKPASRPNAFQGESTQELTSSVYDVNPQESLFRSQELN